MTSRVLLELILIIAALVLGMVAVIEAAWRNWAGWAVTALAVAALIVVWP
jgi:hypothetical protein